MLNNTLPPDLDPNDVQAVQTFKAARHFIRHLATHPTDKPCSRTCSYRACGPIHRGYLPLGRDLAIKEQWAVAVDMPHAVHANDTKTGHMLGPVEPYFLADLPAPSKQRQQAS